MCYNHTILVFWSDGMSRRRGLILVSIGTTCWGVGGTVAQKLFQQFGVDVNWLVTTRLLIAGVLLLTIQAVLKDRSQIFAVWKMKQSAIRILLFAILGMLAVQYTYMSSINYGNAAVATLLQYLAPVMIIIYLVVRGQSRITQKDFITLMLAFVGVFFLLTNGSLSSLTVPTNAIIWGVLSGAAVAYYTLSAVPLLKQFDSLVIVGWAMVIGGFALSFVHSPFDVNLSTFTLEAYMYLLFVILFGTMLAFWFYIESLQSLSPKESSLLGSMEPLSAVLTTVFWLHEPFGVYQWFGTLCILMMIAYMALVPNEKQTRA